VHYLALQIAPVLAAEKSKVPFYIAGGVLVVWALFVSMALGMRKPDFPSTLGQQRSVMGVTAVLVLAAVSMAIATSGGESKAKAVEPVSTTETTATETASTASTPTTAEPKATTGTPPPASSPAAAETKLSLAADPGGQLSYDTDKLTAKAGKVTITMANASPVEHDVAIAEGGKVLGSTPAFVGGSKTVTVTLKPGSYKFYCTVPGHRQAGMEGTLTVS
jgi:plastocyanin